MRIDNDTTSYTGSQLTHSHHHHITKCVMEEEKGRPDAGAMGIKRDTYQAGAGNAAKEETGTIGMGMDMAQRSGRFRIGKGFVRDIWDAMGDEGTSAQKGISPLHDQSADSHARGVHSMTAALSAFRQDLSSYVMNKWENIREKIRTGIHSSLKRFGKDKEGFAMLSNAGHQTDGRKGTEKWKQEEDRKETRTGREEIPAAYQEDNHLMDSYNKTGEYCRLNENLTYQRK